MTRRTHDPRAPRARSGAPSRLPADAIYLGTNVRTGAPFSLPPDAFTRGVHLRGAIGAGKTSLIRQILVALGIGRSFVQFDYIGTGHRELQAWFATMATCSAVAEHLAAALAGSTAAFLRRAAFLTVGTPSPAVRFDLLRRRRLPSGRVEPLRDVVSRAVEIMFVKLNDTEGSQRVRFHRIMTAVLTVLAAGGRPIAEGLTLLDDPLYLRFLDREIESRRFRTSDRVFLQYQRAELAHVLALRPDDPRKGWRAFQDETSSTRNGLAPFAPGTVLGDLFNDETVPLEDVAFGRISLSVTNRAAEDLVKAQAYQAIHAMLHALFLHRPDLPGLPWLPVIVDEPWWMRRNLPSILAVSRNLGVSYFISHQSDAQWLDLGLPNMGRQLRSLTNLDITFRPPTFEDAEEEVLNTQEIHPDGLVQRFWTSASSDTDNSSSTISRSWAHALRYSPYAEFEGSTEHGTHGEGSTSGSGSSTSEHEILNVVGFGDQVKYLAQAAARRPRFQGVVAPDGDGTEVAYVPAPVFRPSIQGVPILDLFRRAQHASWSANAEARTLYDPWNRLAAAEIDTSTLQPAAAPPASIAHATSAAPSTSAGATGQAAVPSSSAGPPKDAPASPASPPTFALPRPTPRGEPQKRSRRRRRPKRGGAPHA
ncbi:MAG TPA: hypothetical protein VEK79_10155 [Thermoanaerobaculia bacterium]|nr:hypothetical protein [Thermoanaerobaculia bacterium]